jgi:DNA repair protein RAD50
MKQIPRQLKACAEEAERIEATISSLENTLDEIRLRIAEIDKEINEGGATLANLRENVRVRKLAADIASIVAEIDAIDIEEVAKAHRNFDEKYNALTHKASEMQNKVGSYHSRPGFERSLTALP